MRAHRWIVGGLSLAAVAASSDGARAVVARDTRRAPDSVEAGAGKASPAAPAPASPKAASAAPAPGSLPAPLVPPPAPPPAAAPVDPARYDSDASLPAHADAIVRYQLRASLDPVAHTVHGEGTLTWRNASTVPVREIWVHLYLNAFKNQRSVFMREPVGGFRGNDPVKDWGAIDVRKFALEGEGEPTDLWSHAELHRPGDEDETDVRVPLPREIAPGESVTFDMAWDDELPSIVERTGYDQSFHMIAQWFPKIARLERDGRWAHFPFHHLAEFYADYGTYDVTVDVPEAFVIGACGPMVDARIEKGRRIERHVQADVHDFAWSAWDEFQTLSETIDGVNVTLLYPPNFRVDAQRELRAMRFALPHFSEKYGRYPYDVLTVVHPPEEAEEAGGMEYPTLITTGGPWYGPPWTLALEAVTIHEFGHQYFYGLIGTHEVEWPFLDEGLNSYAEQLALATWRGPGSIGEFAGLTVSDSAIDAMYSAPFVHTQPVAQPAYAFTSGGAYGALVYGQTATILETMRRVYGDDAVTRALGRYARRYRFQHPLPDDLLASFAEVLGPRPAETLRTALFDEGWVNYRVLEVASSEVREPAGIFDGDGGRRTVGDAGSAHASGYEGWVLVAREGTLAFPVEIELTRADGTTDRVHWDDGGASLRIPYRGAVPLRGAVIDPDHAVLLDRDLQDNHATAQGERGAGAPRTLERALYWAELLVQSVLP